MNLNFETSIENNKDSGIITLQQSFQGKNFFAGQLQVLQSPLMVELKNTKLHEKSGSCLTITTILNNSPVKGHTLKYFVVGFDHKIIKSGEASWIDTRNVEVCMQDILKVLPIGNYRLHFTRDNCTLSTPLIFSIVELPVVRVVTPCAVDVQIGGNFFIEGANFTQGINVKLGNFVVPQTNIKVNGLLTQIKLSFSSIPDSRLLDINSEIFLSNNEGKDWNPTNIHIQFTSISSNSVLYQNLHSESSKVNEQFSIFSSTNYSESISNTNSWVESVKEIISVKPPVEFQKIFFRPDTLISKAATSINVSSFSFDSISDSFCVTNLTDKHYEFHHTDDVTGFCKIENLLSNYTNFESPIEILIFAKFYAFDNSKVFPIEDANSKYQASVYVFEGINILNLNYDDIPSTATEMIRKIGVEIEPMTVPDLYSTKISCILNELENSAASSLNKYETIAQLGAIKINGTVEKLVWEFKIHAYDPRKYYLTIQIANFKSEFRKQVIISANIPKITLVDTHIFEYDYSKIGIKEEYINFTVLYEEFTNFTCNFDVFLNEKFQTILTTEAIFLEKVGGNLLTNDLISGVSILKYSWTIPWDIIIQNSDTQIYLAVNSLASSRSRILYDLFSK